MVIGIIGAVVPGIPGTSLILIAIVIWGAVQGSLGSGVPLVGYRSFVLSVGIDFLVATGAKRAGQVKGRLSYLVGLAFSAFASPTVWGPLLGSCWDRYWARLWESTLPA